MKIIYENEWERAAVHVDIEIPYEEDYQMRMLGHNRINSLLKVTGNGRDGQSRYTFYPGDSLSMEKQYSRQEMKREDIERFTEQFIAMVDIVKAHLLDPDRILLTPELIFIKDGAYRFCYLPVREMERKKSLFLSFHEMTEYFVKKLDYQDTEGILLVYRLHKETLKENYDLKKILEEYHKEESCKEKNQRMQCKTEEMEIYQEKDQKDQKDQKDPGFADRMLEQVRQVKGIPVVAHAERYEFVQDDPEIVYRWKQSGCEIQVNKGSFMGRFGRHAREAAYALLNHNLVSVIASDAHSPIQRTTCMADAYDELLGGYPREYLDVLFDSNPKRICNGEKTVGFKKIPFREAYGWKEKA